MFDFLIEIIELNIDYRSILTYVLVYIFSLWLLFAVWVYFDAQKRYESQLLPSVLALVVFVLNFPALIFYLIIRPEDEDDYVFIHHPEEGDMIQSTGSSTRGGMQIPLVQFTDEAGDSVLTFQVTVNKHIANPHLNVKVDMADHLEVIEEAAPTIIEHNVKVPETNNEKVMKQAEGILERITGMFKKIKADIGEYAEEIQKHEQKTLNTKVEEKKMKGKTKKQGTDMENEPTERTEPLALADEDDVEDNDIESKSNEPLSKAIEESETQKDKRKSRRARRRKRRR